VQMDESPISGEIRDQNAGNPPSPKKSIMVHIKLQDILQQTFVYTQVGVHQQNM
jgi:hypothetical protein